MSNGRGSRLHLRAALALVWLLGRFVPRRRRRTWVAEWHGELSYYWHQSPDSPGPTDKGVLRRSVASLPHAVALARQEWSPDTMFQDLFYALRRLRNNPGFALVAIVTLAIGIGANTAIFSVVHSTLINPLPYEESGRLVFLWKQTADGFLLLTPDADEVDAWRATGAFEEVHTYGASNVTVTGGAEPVYLTAGHASAGLFSFLGARPVLGRDFTDAEATAGDRVAILSYGYWQQRFGGDGDVLGRTLEIGDEPVRVVGVLPAAFRFRVPFEDAPIWLPFEPDSREAASPLSVARLREGVTPEAAAERMQTTLDELAGEDNDVELRASVQTPQDMLGEAFASNIFLLQAAVGMVLLIACANVATLLLARGTGLRREMAVRTAVGAGRGRLVRQLLTENLVLALAAGAAGYGLARAGVWAIDVLRPVNYSALAGIRVDASILAFTMLVAIGCGIVVGLVPALRAAHTQVVDQIRGSGGSDSAGPGRVWLRNTLIVAEVAMSFVLLAGAALLLNSLGQLLAGDLGFDPENVVTMSVELPEDRYPEDIVRDAFFDDLEQRVRAALGDRLESMAYVSGTPPRMGVWFGDFLTEDHQEVPAFTGTMARASNSSPGFLGTMGIPLLAGRDFTAADLEAVGTEGAVRPVIVNGAWARAMWGTEAAVGEGFSTETRTEGEFIEYTVVGVIDDAKLMGPIPDRNGFVAFRPRTPGSGSASLVVRLTDDPGPQIPLIKEQVWALDPDLPLRDTAIVEDLLALTMSAQRFNATLMSIFALVAVVLAAVGLYGVLSYTVGQRTREIGIRVALGARRGHVIPMVAWQGMQLVLLGLVIGIGAALGLARYVESMLYEITGTHAATYAVVAVTLLLVAALACLVPARRAASLQVVEALREG